MMHYLPIALNMQDAKIIFAGGGTEASAKVRLLMPHGASITVIAETLNADLQHYHEAQKITWIAQRPRPEHLASHLADCMIFYAATGDKTNDATLIQAAKPYARLVTAVDQPALGDFITPALIRRPPVTIAITTQGAAPVLARMLKMQIETLIPKNIGTLADYAKKIRTQIHQHLHGNNRRKFWEWFFIHAPNQAMPNHQQSRKNVDAKNIVARFLSSAHANQSGALLFLPEDNHLDMHALENLRHADSIYYQSKKSCSDWLELARREADYFPQNLPDKDALTHAKQHGLQLCVIAPREKLPLLCEQSQQIGLPIHYLGTMKHFLITCETARDLESVNWHNLRHGEIFLPYKLFSALQAALLDAKFSRKMPLFVNSKQGLQCVTLENLLTSPKTANHILFQRLAQIHHLQPQKHEGESYCYDEKSDEKSYVQNL